MGADKPIRITVQKAGAGSSIAALAAVASSSDIMGLGSSQNEEKNKEEVQIPRLNSMEYNLTLVERMISASSGAILTSLLVTPFDVVKTRLQASIQRNGLETYDPAECPRCSKYILHNGLMEHELPKSKLLKIVNCDHRFSPHYTGTLDAMLKISRTEGIFSLYNGLPPTLLMAVPATVLYFAAYDALRSGMRKKGIDNSMLNPLLAGTLARTLATTSIAPFELMRTKMQSINNPPGMVRLGLTQVRQEGFRSLWKGLSLTLWRDVPFSAVYWMCVETTKSHLGTPNTRLEAFRNSFIAGATGGMIAATITHPFDVVKTQLQMIHLRDGEQVNTSTSTLQTIRAVSKERGVSSLFVGLTPRLTKVTAACAIMLSSYEFGKHYFAAQRWGDDEEAFASSSST